MDLIRQGQKITLYFPKEDNMVEMTCSIEGVYDDRLVVSLPQYFMRYIDSLAEGSVLTAKIFTRLGTIDFNTIVISSPLEEFFEIELDYNALKLTENSEISVVSAVETLEIKGGFGATKVKTFELSTEFVKFTSDKTFKVGESYGFTLFLPKDYGIINFSGTITEIDPIYENEYTARFMTITETDRQLLLYYMYVYSSPSG